MKRIIILLIFIISYSHHDVFAQITKLPFVEVYNNPIDYFRILQTEKSKTSFKVTFILQYTGLGQYQTEIGAVNSNNELVVIDKSNGKQYKSLLKETKLISAKQFMATTFTIEFQPIPSNTMIIDIKQASCNRDDLCFNGIHLESNDSRTNQQNIQLFNTWKSAGLNPNVISTIQQNNQNPNIKTMPNGWQYEIIKKGNGKCIDLANFKNYIHSKGNVKLYTRWHEYKSVNGRLQQVPFERNEEYKIGLKNSISAIRGYRYTLEEALLLMDEGAIWKLYIPGYASGDNVRYSGIYDYYIAELEINEHVFKPNTTIIKSEPIVAKSNNAKPSQSFHDMVQVLDVDLFVARGDGATFSQFLRSDENTSFKNRNAFVIGKIQNNSSKRIKVKVDVTYFIESETSGLFGFGGNRDVNQYTYSVFHEIQPKSYVPLITVLKFTAQSSNLAGVAFNEVNLSSTKPYEITYSEYTGIISQKTMDDQNLLFNQVKNNGNIPIVDGWEKELSEKKQDISRKQNANQTGNYYFIDNKNAKVLKYSCKGGNYSYKVIPVKCNCYNTDTYNIYYWNGSCGYKAGYYNSQEFAVDSYLGATEKELVKTLKSKCGCD
ncbi:MAG TPA: hypothetical protein PKC41_04300 [Chitinophagaceae bacterium]|nr:hypothetical protein [Chitinophagaceae bacterium]